MSNDFFSLTTESIRKMKAYEPGKNPSDINSTVSSWVKLASNENALGPSPKATEAAKEAIDHIHLYPASHGSKLKCTLSKQLNIQKDTIALGSGSDELITLLIQCFAHSKQYVLFPKTSFIAYEVSARASNASIEQTPVDEKFSPDLDALIEACHRHNAAIIFIANPNNPTGSWLTHNEIKKLLDNIPPTTLLVIDEAYYEYAKAEAHYPDCLKLQKMHTNLVILRTFSKAYGLAGLRIGYIIAHPDIINLINRIRKPFNINNIALAAANAALNDKTHLDKIIKHNEKERTKVFHALKALKLNPLPSAGNFIMFHAITNAQRTFETLLNHGIIIRPLNAFGLPEHLRVSIGLTKENDRFIEAIKELL